MCNLLTAHQGIKQHTLENCTVCVCVCVWKENLLGLRALQVLCLSTTESEEDTFHAIFGTPKDGEPSFQREN